VTEVSTPSLALRGALPRAMLFIAGVSSIAAVDAMLRAVLSENLYQLLPALSTCAGAGLAWYLAGTRGTSARNAPNPLQDDGETRSDHAVVQANVVAAGDDRAIRDDFAAIPDARQNAGVRRAVMELGHYQAFTYILNKQMNSVTELSEEAAGSILSNLTSADGKITSLLDFIQQSGSNDLVGRVITQIESQMEDCRQLLQRFAARQSDNAELGLQQGSKIVENTNSVLDILGKVSGISRQTTMISFNVSIEAERVGEASKGFAIIALEIRKLASEVQTLSRDMHVRVQALMQSVTVDLPELAKQRERAEGEAITNITEALDGLGGNLIALITHQRNILQKVESEGESIARPILDIMGRIQFQDIIRQQLGQLDQMAEMVSEHIKSVGMMLADPEDAMGEETLSQKIDGMFDSYVMARQRDTHMAARGQSIEQAAGSLIELF
jgi:methyl-accepting chemotaxis protein